MKSQTKLILIGVIIMILLSTTIVMTIFADVEGPTIHEINILPENPVEGDYISVTVFCTDSSGISNAQLSYTINGIDWQIQDMSFHACLCAAGGRWMASFGPITDSDYAAFYLTAFDNSFYQNHAESRTFTIDLTST